MVVRSAKQGAVFTNTKGASVILGLTESLPAPSGYYLAQNYSFLSSDYYWIQSDAMPNPLLMWVDMDEEGGGYDMYPIQGNGISTNYANQTHSGTALGLDIPYPRSKFHWRAMLNYVYYELGESGGNYQRWFNVIYGVHKTSGGGNFTGTIMRNPTFYGSGSSAHRVNDNGRWWLRDTTYTEPNGDYTANAWFDSRGMPEPYGLQDMVFNDGNANYSTGNYYLVSTNAKP